MKGTVEKHLWLGSLQCIIVSFFSLCFSFFYTNVSQNRFECWQSICVVKFFELHGSIHLLCLCISLLRYGTFKLLWFNCISGQSCQTGFVHWHTPLTANPEKRAAINLALLWQCMKDCAVTECHSTICKSVKSKLSIVKLLFWNSCLLCLKAHWNNPDKPSHPIIQI